MFPGPASRAVASVAAVGAAAAVAAVPASNSGSRVARSDAHRPGLASLAPPEVAMEELVVFPGSGTSGPCMPEMALSSRESSYSSSLDSWLAISEEDVRDAIGPIVSVPMNPASPPSDSESEGTEANNQIMQAEAIIRNIHAMATDRAIQEAVYNHPAMQEMLAEFTRGQPLLMPPAAAVLASQPYPTTTVDIQEVTDWNIVDIIVERLKEFGSHCSSVCSKVGNFFQGVAAKFTNRGGSSASPDKSGDHGNGGIFGVMFALVCIVLISIAAKKIPTAVVRRG